MIYQPVMLSLPFGIIKTFIHKLKTGKYVDFDAENITIEIQMHEFG